MDYNSSERSDVASVDAEKRIQEFFAKRPVKTYGSGEALVQLGASPRHVFYLEKGAVQQYDISPSGAVVVVNVFKPGSFFPMSWALHKSHNYYCFEAVGQVAVRIAEPEDVVKFVEADHDVTLNLLRRVLSGSEGLQRRMAHLMGGSARNRLLFELVVECARFGKPSPKGGCLLLLGEEDLARRSGLTRETISRELKKLKHESLVEVRHKQIVVKSIDSLKELLGEEI